MGDKSRIVIVDDDPDVRETLSEYLEANGMMVETAQGGMELRDLIKEHSFDLAVLDLRMPGEDGLSLCRFLRENYEMGIVMLTGSGDSIDRIVGLEVGADDYVSKPFELRELLARVRAVLRRVSKSAHSLNSHANSGSTSKKPAAALEEGDDFFAFGPVRIDANKLHLIGADGGPSALTKMEFDLIKTFAERPKRVLSRDFLLEAAHGKDWEPFDRSVDIRVTRLRKKIEPNPAKPRFLKTVRGVGYLYDPDGE